MRSGLTKRQDEIYQYVKTHWRQHGFPPSVRDVCKAFNYTSSSTAFSHLSAIVRKGYLSNQGRRGFIPVERGEVEKELAEQVLVTLSQSGEVHPQMRLLLIRMAERVLNRKQSEAPVEGASD